MYVKAKHFDGPHLIPRRNHPWSFYREKVMTTPTRTLMYSSQNREAVCTVCNVFRITPPGCEPDTSPTR